MFKGLGDMARLMDQARQMQEKLGEAQARIGEIEARGEAGAGLVRATVTGKGELRAVEIDPSLMIEADREVLQDLLVAAVNDAHGRAQAAAQAEMAKLTEGLPMPPGFKLFG
jgi:DNA-binding YbaB/EbfC family protein